MFRLSPNERLKFSRRVAIVAMAMLVLSTGLAQDSVDREGYFEKIIPLSHPRFIMQYKRKKLDEYLNMYKNALAIN